MTPPISPAAARAVAQNTAFRQARTCYGHLAGVAGVALLDALLQHGWLASDGGAWRLTAAVQHSEPAVQRLTGRPCLDWTERRPHLGGPLGRWLTRMLVEDGVLAPGGAPRQIALLGSIEDWLARRADGPMA